MKKNSILIFTIFNLFILFSQWTNANGDLCENAIKDQLKEFGVSPNIKSVKKQNHERFKTKIKEHQDAYLDAHYKLKEIEKKSGKIDEGSDEVIALNESIRNAESGFREEVQRYCKTDAFDCQRVKDLNIADSVYSYEVETFEDLAMKKNVVKEDKSFSKLVRTISSEANDRNEEDSRKLIKASRAILTNPGSDPSLKQLARRNMQTAQNNLLLASIRKKPSGFEKSSVPRNAAYDRIKIYRGDHRAYFYTVSHDDNSRTPEMYVRLDNSCSPSWIEIQGNKLNADYCSEDNYEILSQYKHVGCRMLNLKQPSSQRIPASDFRPYLNQNR